MKNVVGKTTQSNSLDATSSLTVWLVVSLHIGRDEFITSKIYFLIYLTYFWPIFLFLSSWKHHKTFGFLVFSEGIKCEHWQGMG